MKVIKSVNGHEVELVLDKEKDYFCTHNGFPKFSMYQVSKLINGIKVPLYKTCLSLFEVRDIVENGYRMKPDKEY